MSSYYLRQSTASQEVMIGPFLDDTDGKTAETALTIANTDIKIFKAGAVAEVNKNSGGATHVAAGRYYAVFDATDTDTLGSGEINVHVSGALPCKVRFIVLPAQVYDSIVAGSDLLQVDTTQVTGAAQTANDMSGDIDTLLTRVIGTIASGTHNPQSGDSFARIGATGSGLTSLAQSSTAISNVVWTDAKAAFIDAAISSRLATAGYTAPDNATISAISAFVDTEVAAIKAKTDNLPASPAAVSNIPTAAAIRAEIDANSSQLAKLGAPSGASISADIAAVKIVSDGIKAKTDSLTFTKAGEVDANVQSINGATIIGNGSTTPFDVS